MRLNMLAVHCSTLACLGGACTTTAYDRLDWQVQPADEPHVRGHSGQRRLRCVCRRWRRHLTETESSIGDHHQAASDEWSSMVVSRVNDGPDNGSVELCEARSLMLAGPTAASPCAHHNCSAADDNTPPVRLLQVPAVLTLWRQSCCGDPSHASATVADALGLSVLYAAHYPMDKPSNHASSIEVAMLIGCPSVRVLQPRVMHICTKTCLPEVAATTRQLPLCP